MPSVLDILRPSVVVGIMNEIRTPYQRWQDFFGLGPKGPNTVLSPTRTVSVDIANDDRTLSGFTAPGADAFVIAPMVIGNRTVTAPRTFEKLPLSFETLNNIRAIGKNAGELDRAGMSYINQQSGHGIRRMRRWREFLIWGALRGACHFKFDTNLNWIPLPSSSGADVTLDWQVSANNKNQLNGIIGTSWNTTATAPIITDLGQINAAAEESSGIPITHAWCNSSRWSLILQNAQVISMGGSAQTPFEMYQAIYKTMPNYGGEGTGITGNQTEHVGVLRGYPSITWHITDRGLTLDGTFTKYLGDDEVLFHPDPSNEWMFGYEVKESTNQVPNQSPIDVFGFGSWIKMPFDADTPRYDLFMVDNFFPVMNPRAVFYADVTP